MALSTLLWQCTPLCQHSWPHPPIGNEVSWFPSSLWVKGFLWLLSTLLLEQALIEKEHVFFSPTEKYKWCIYADAHPFVEALCEGFEGYVINEREEKSVTLEFIGSRNEWPFSSKFLFPFSSCTTKRQSIIIERLPWRPIWEDATDILCISLHLLVLQTGANNCSETGSEEFKGGANKGSMDNFWNWQRK